MRVCKFGGSSLADAEHFRAVCDIVASNPERRVVVVSAPGKRHADDIKVTDMLIACANARLAGEPTGDKLAEIVDRYASIADGLGLSREVVGEISEDLSARVESGAERRDSFLDSMKAAGEDNCARMMAVALRAHGLDANYLSPKEAGLALSAEHGNAQILPQTYGNLAAIGRRPGVTVFPGFFGYSPDGEVVTFSRGGSDISGAVLAAALKADLYENFTDVDSVLGADPDVVDNPAPIPELTYHEMRELSYAGFGVLHDEAIMPIVEAGVPVCIRSVSHPDTGGTMIVPERKYEAGQVVGIAGGGGFCTVSVSKYLMNREIGFGRRLLQIFEEEGISYEHTPSGIDNMSVVVREDDLDHVRQGHVVTRIKRELEVDDIDVEHGLALIMIVGEGMRYTVGMAAKAVNALAEAGVNIEMMNQGASEISMMFGVKEVDRRRAVRSLHKAFFETPFRRKD